LTSRLPGGSDNGLGSSRLASGQWPVATLDPPTTHSHAHPHHSPAP
jgi:hypothetical protein